MVRMEVPPLREGRPAAVVVHKRMEERPAQAATATGRQVASAKVARVAQETARAAEEVGVIMAAEEAADARMALGAAGALVTPPARAQSIHRGIRLVTDKS